MNQESNDTASPVSVVVPTRNRAESCVRAATCVLRQTYSALELLIVDDASSDDTADRLAELADPRLHYIRHEQRKGAAAARNTGIRNASSELLAFLDDDDEWLPEKLRRQIDAMQWIGDTVGVVVCGYEVVSDLSGKVVRTVCPSIRPGSPTDFLRSTSFMTSVPLIRKACFETVGFFDEALPGTQDRDMWIRIADRFAFDHIPDVLVRYHVHGRQISTDLSRKVLAKQMFLQKHRHRLEQHPDLLAQHLERLGMLYCANDQPEPGRRCFREGIEVMPDRASLQEHLRRSLADPASHKRHLMEKVFPKIEGLTLFY